jgi:hypothetical protein
MNKLNRASNLLIYLATASGLLHAYPTQVNIYNPTDTQIMVTVSLLEISTSRITKSPIPVASNQAGAPFTKCTAPEGYAIQSMSIGTSSPLDLQQYANTVNVTYNGSVFVANLSAYFMENTAYTSYKNSKIRQFQFAAQKAMAQRFASAHAWLNSTWASIKARFNSLFTWISPFTQTSHVVPTPIPLSLQTSLDQTLIIQNNSRVNVTCSFGLSDAALRIGAGRSLSFPLKKATRIVISAGPTLEEISLDSYLQQAGSHKGEFLYVAITNSTMPGVQFVHEEPKWITEAQWKQYNPQQSTAQPAPAPQRISDPISYEIEQFNYASAPFTLPIPSAPPLSQEELRAMENKVSWQDVMDGRLGPEYQRKVQEIHNTEYPETVLNLDQELQGLFSNWGRQFAENPQAPPRASRIDKAAAKAHIDLIMKQLNDYRKEGKIK